MHGGRQHETFIRLHHYLSSALSWFSLTGIVAADSLQYDKSVSIIYDISTTGKSRRNPRKYITALLRTCSRCRESFTGELIAADGSIVKTFTVWDPRVQFGDTIVSNSGNPRIQGVVDRQDPADFVVIFPFDRNVTEFRLYNSAEGTLLSSVNLKPQMDSFFASYPNDPDNPALSGFKAPAMANTAAVRYTGSWCRVLRATPWDSGHR